jgi:hypothetical protein
MESFRLKSQGGAGETNERNEVIAELRIFYPLIEADYIPLFMSSGQGLSGPASYVTGIQMHKIGSSVITDAATLHGQRCISNPSGIYAFNADINRPAFHVQTIFGDAVAVSA